MGVRSLAAVLLVGVGSITGAVLAHKPTLV